MPLSLWFVYALLGHLDDSYNELVAWVSSPFVTVMLLALIAAVFYHAKLGIQVVIEDYIHTESSKLLLLIATKLALVFGALLGIVAVLQIAFTTA